MPHQLSIEELQQAYLELQSRVTRFSAKEQELINVRDLLDQELLGYKRMNAFHAAAIELDDIPSLLELVAETMVDLFDTEVGFACFRKWGDPDEYHCHLEGGGSRNAEAWKSALKGVCAHTADGVALHHGPDHAGALLAGHMVGKKTRPGTGVEMVVVAAISKAKEEIYATFNDRKLVLFKLFLESCSAYLESISARNRINDQLETIRRSEVELRRLSLIATNTHSGVIITDGKGRIVWVNEAFKSNTGYAEEEVIGKKPREFLQAPDLNDADTLHQLSEGLRKRENVSVDLKNVRKDGALFYIRLNISPVFDHAGRLVNFIAIQQDITAQKLNEERMVEQNDELTKINKELDQFVYSISHDLRAPLLSIQGLLGLMDVADWDEENQQYVRLIRESTVRLDHTILEILNYSRNARLDVQFAPFNVRQTIDHILDDLGSMRRDVETTVTCSGSEEVVQDEVRVGVLMKNILANAIKYSKRGDGQAHVSVRVDSTPQAVQLVVTDNGEGIDSAHIDKVFDMFYRATRSSPGTGLGLYISKEITEKIGGTISLESEVGVGTEVTITLPQHRHESVLAH